MIDSKHEMYKCEETNRLIERSNDLYNKKRELEERLEKNKYAAVISDALKVDLKEIEEEYKKHKEIEEQKYISFFKEDWGQWLRKGKGDDYANIEDDVLYSNDVDKGFFQIGYSMGEIHLLTTGRFESNWFYMPLNNIFLLSETHAYTAGSDNTTTVIRFKFIFARSTGINYNFV